MVSLSKKVEEVNAQAPHLSGMFTESAKIVLRKGLNPDHFNAAVVASLDDSYSAQGLYASGEMQSATDMAFTAGFLFDDDGSVPVSFFSNDTKDLGEVTIGTVKGFVARQKPRWNGTSYVAALRWVIEQAGYSHIDLRNPLTAAAPASSGGFLGFGKRPVASPTEGPLTVKATTAVPTFAIIFTDGDPQDKEETEKLLRQMSQLPIFVQWIGVGDFKFTFLTKLNDLEGGLIDNSGFYDIKKAGGNQTKVLEGLLNEFPDYVNKAKQLGLITA
ncbi:MAG: VWA domain-containing protein [Candidatus Microsaccharimonas sp.]